MTVLIICLCVLTVPLVPLPGGSIGSRVFRAAWEKPSKPSQFEQLQKAAFLSDPLALEALREVDALLPESPQFTPQPPIFIATIDAISNRITSLSRSHSSDPWIAQMQAEADLEGAKRQLARTRSRQ